jgi:RimJ/RimL family protein N-acetyltransferase
VGGSEIMIVFETDRLIARVMRTEDAGDLFAWKSDPEIARYEYWEPMGGMEDARREVGALASRPVDTIGEWNEYGLCFKPDAGGRLIGSVSVRFEKTAARLEAEIGFKLARSYQGHGYATEAGQALIAHSIKRGARRVFAVVDARNLACIALLGRLGMRCDVSLGRGCFAKGEWCEERVYTLPSSLQV